MAAIAVKSYDEMPGSTVGSLSHRYRPDDWPDNEEYHEVFTLPSGKWFAVMEDPRGGATRTSAKDTQGEAFDAIYEHVQFTRRFWDQKVDWMNNGDWTIPDPKGDRRHRKPERVARIGGQHYVVGAEPTAQEMERNRQYGGLGHGGHEFKIRFNDGTVCITHNLWAQGPIHPEYLPILTDNARFLD
jgi:hypothetical protein